MDTTDPRRHLLLDSSCVYCVDEVPMRAVIVDLSGREFL